jgi:sugar phosphate isomerase/epimerase
MAARTRIGISNIAWDVEHDAQVAELLAGSGIGAIDIAPRKYFPDPFAATPDDTERVRRWWLDRGVEITGMQGLLFGTTGLNMFGDAASQSEMLRHLGGVCRLAGMLRAPRLVFGSPRNRDRSGVDDAQCDRIAIDFFRRLGDIAAGHEVLICLEANPARYHCNFMTHTDETARMVGLVDHPAVRMQLDTGTMTINGEPYAEGIRRHARLIGHVHASEPDLVTLGEGGTDHRAVAAALDQALPGQLVMIEMASVARDAQLAAVARGLKVALGAYGPAPKAAS